MKYLKKFEQKDLYESYISNSPILPNVSYIKGTNQMSYNPFIDTSVYDEWVDLGLPSGLLWANRNIGATKSEEYGLYFAWGETQGYSGITDEKQFTWEDYKFGTQYTLTKYGADGLTTLELEDDAAYQSDNTCRIPTQADFEELTTNTTSIWETLNGVKGRRFTSKTNSNSIFIPAAGACGNSSVGNVGFRGFLWSSSLNESGDPRYGWHLGFGSGYAIMDRANRSDGFSVRPVKPNNYMYVEALEDGMTVSFTKNKNAKSGSLYYSLDKQKWNKLTGNTPAINSGEKVYFKGDLVPASGKGIGTFTINKQCNVTGNIMSLLFMDDLVGKTDLTGYDFAFEQLFFNCTTIQSAKNLILPATTLANNCYSYMFSGCKSLTTAPSILPATTLAFRCYSAMFNGCKSLSFASELPATELAYCCYEGMFLDCYSLVNAPQLPATTLTEGCYDGMFNRCTSLTTAPELPATELANRCYYQMFLDCTNLQVVTKSEFIAFNDLNSGFNGILKDCYMPKNQNVIINLSDTDEVVFNYSDGIYSVLRDEIILTDILSQEDISTLTPEYDLVVTVYGNYPDPHIVNEPIIYEHITWEAGQSLEEFAEKFNFDYTNTSISILYTSRNGGDYYYV